MGTFVVAQLGSLMRDCPGVCGGESVHSHIPAYLQCCYSG